MIESKKLLLIMVSVLILIGFGEILSNQNVNANSNVDNHDLNRMILNRDGDERNNQSIVLSKNQVGGVVKICGNSGSRQFPIQSKKSIRFNRKKLIENGNLNIARRNNAFENRMRTTRVYRHSHICKTRYRVHRRYFYVSESKTLRFQSQYGTDACEMAAVKNVLSIHHEALHTSLNTMLNCLGWGGNWNYHYTGNPYTDRGVTISPWLQAKIIRKYGVKAYVHNYMSGKQIINQLRQGHQLIIEAGHRCYSHRLSDPYKPSDHVLAIIGIKRNRHGLFVQYADSEEITKKSGVKWCPFRRLWRSYNRPSVTGDHSVVIV